ncbi:hypothetical protein OPW39_15900 [Vibrio europaeus]|uniref:hypothetical protein n=1 Tax=Vibrio europaeus TaxID=300876 RepID=UPI00233ECEE1|nr:hypothetical protein [Vibrio europaeus]MDC5870292.1 hypothetical protein [Vibrio europaeus]
MKKAFAIVFAVALLSLVVGCKSTPKDSTLSTAQRVEVINAKVANPYPDCKPSEQSLRIANLSLKRGLRVYLQDGKLCKK